MTWSWLGSTRRLQEEAYGVDYELLAKQGPELADRIIWNVLALQDELHEFLAECQWKPWAVDRGGVARDRAVGELVDAAHFLANLATFLGVTDEEWEARYQEKQARNAARQAAPGGYTGNDKCPECKRELDAPGAKVAGHCAGCGARLTGEDA